MGALSLSLVFVGYVLVYGAVANHGQFATAPWAGVFVEAYDVGQEAGAAAGTGLQSNAPAPGRQRTTRQVV